MCGGVSYKSNGKVIKTYFPIPMAQLPILKRDKSYEMLIWGRRREENGDFPLGGWARHESIQNGVWDKYQPQPVKIPVDNFMEKDKDRVSHWFDLEDGQFLQGLIAHLGQDRRIYVVTVEPKANAIHDRMPRVIST